MSFDFGVPVELTDAVGPIRMTARINGKTLGTRDYKTDGRYVWQQKVPSEMLDPNPVVVEFEIDRTRKDQGRELGVMAVSVSLTHPESVVLSHDAAVDAARDDYVRLLKQRESKCPSRNRKR
jgi:hypothetical protein